AQQLAPKIYPDKQIEETISTKKHVKRTETSADGGSGGVSAYRAITGSKGAIEVPSNGYHVREAERRGMVDLTSGVVTPFGADRSLNLEEAFTLGVLNPNSITIKDPKSGRSLNAREAIQQKVMDKNGGLDNRGRRLTLQEAVEERIVHLEAEPPATLSQANKKIIQLASGQGPVMNFRPVGQAVVEEHDQAWSFDAQSGQFVDLQSGQTLSIDRALESGKLSADDLRVRDASTGRELSFDEAQRWGIINLRDGYYLDKTNNQRYNFTEAARQQRIYPTGGVPENAADSVHTTLKSHTRSEISKKEAIPTGSPAVEYNISKLVNSRAYDASSGLFQPPDAQKQMTLKQLIVKGYLNPYNTMIVDRRQRRDLTLIDAIDENIVDAVAGTVKDTSTGRTHDFASAVRDGLVKESAPDSYDASFGSQQQRLGNMS
uniref:Uncharacterized protein n=1 Tax=Acrobeloides nanus TaxID=290746 RepID=A0A914CVV5_9BILA